MKKLMILLAATTLSFSTGKVQAVTNSMFIEGYVDPAITKLYNCDLLTIRLINTINPYSLGRRMEASIDTNGHFKTSISFDGNFTYVAFEFEDRNSNNHYGMYTNASFPRERAMDEAYLFEQSDKVSVDIRPGGNISFSGKGSNKLTCQSMIYNIDPIPTVVNFRITALGINESSLLLLRNAIDRARHQRLEILESYKAELSAKVYDMIYLDAVSSVKYSFMQFLYSRYILKLSELDSINIRNYLIKSQDNADDIGYNKVASANSAYYADMLFQQHMTKSKVLEPKSPPAIANIYEIIKKKYTGLLQDKLFYICFERLSLKSFSQNINMLIEDALSTMQSEKYKQLLRGLSQKQNKAFAFDALYDSNGVEYKLASFKGKLLVIDFWFTGCGACQFLATAMNPIMEKFKDNPYVKFISVSTDINREAWLKSVLSEKYCSKDMLNLHTNKVGFNHPMIKYYNFRGFPEQLIIDANGKLVSSSPPRPFSVGDRLTFISLIDNNLPNKAGHIAE